MMCHYFLPPLRFSALWIEKKKRIFFPVLLRIENKFLFISCGQLPSSARYHGTLLPYLAVFSSNSWLCSRVTPCVQWTINNAQDWGRVNCMQSSCTKSLAPKQISLMYQWKLNCLDISSQCLSCLISYLREIHVVLYGKPMYLLILKHVSSSLLIFTDNEFLR